MGEIVGSFERCNLGSTAGVASGEFFEVDVDSLGVRAIIFDLEHLGGMSAGVHL